MKIISFALWGAEECYVQGAIKNCEAAAVIYPEWVLRFYLASSVSQELRDTLRRYPSVEIVEIPQEYDGWACVFSRFHACADPAAEAIIIRDLDSCVSRRERACVDAWLLSGRNFHIMRDHPKHDQLMMAGMWGVRGGVLSDINEIVEPLLREATYFSDQVFLAQHIYPICRSSVLVHDEIYEKRPYPIPRQGLEFVGERFLRSEADMDTQRLREYLTDGKHFNTAFAFMVRHYPTHQLIRRLRSIAGRIRRSVLSS